MMTKVYIIKYLTCMRYASIVAVLKYKTMTMKNAQCSVVSTLRAHAISVPYAGALKGLQCPGTP